LVFIAVVEKQILAIKRDARFHGILAVSDYFYRLWIAIEMGSTGSSFFRGPRKLALDQH
jgi:hypothetical protein